MMRREADQPCHYTFQVRQQMTAQRAFVCAYPVVVHDAPDWPAFVQRMVELHADHFTLIADAGLPEPLIFAFYAHLQATGKPCLLICLEIEESTKTMETALSIATQAREHGGGTHQSCFVSLGGGVVGNIVGLAATLLVRGVRFIHIPTTLLAATDSALSLKQGVNVRLSAGHLIKNLLGAFSAPELVLVYLSLWDTLPREEIRSGLCELVKNVVGIHPERFDEVAALLRPDAFYTLAECHRIFELCFDAKQAVMRHDAHEKRPALILELGHTFGHAWEAHTGLAHGLAVGLGMLVAGRISVARGLLQAEELAQITTLLQRNGAPTTLPANLDLEPVLALIGNDNKIGYLPRRSGYHTMVLLEHLGKPVMEAGLPLTYVADAELRAAMAALQDPAGQRASQKGASYAL